VVQDADDPNAGSKPGSFGSERKTRSGAHQAPDPEPVAPPQIPIEIGEYRILGKLGEGGMGVVYEAEQRRPRRKVALKVVHGGRFVDATFLSLFRREVETLARLKHPHIGAIYESGCTEDGQHYFAMELVSGETLDRFLKTRPRTFDREELEYRLRLFRKITDAVHYAHQRGVIHRDLKPSNIIVTGLARDASDRTLVDPVPEVKILDFGLARIVGEGETSGPMLTEVGTIRGTLSYMSPEQARGNPEDLDVRADVYALGVMLYEMLTDSRPYDAERRTLLDAVKVICEQPPRSLRENWRGRRKLDTDLETIVATALEKEADRRYGSAAAFSEDIGRYLGSLPIQARPPSTAYQLRKAIARHKLGFAFAATVALLLIGFGVGMSVLFARALEAEAQATHEAETAERALDFLTDTFVKTSPSRARGSTITAREILDNASVRIETELGGQPEAQARLMGTVGWVYRGLGLYEEALPLLRRSLELRREVLGPEHVNTLHAMNDLAVLYVNLGQFAEAQTLHEQTLAAQRRVLGSDHEDTLRSMGNLAVLRVKQGRHDEAALAYNELIESQRRVLGPRHRETLRSVNNLAILYHDLGRYEEAEPLYRTTLEERLAELGDDHPESLNSMNNLAVLLEIRGRYDEAEPLYLRCLEGQRRVLGDDHPETLTSLFNLGNLYLRQDRLGEAGARFAEVAERQEHRLGADHPDTLDTLYNLACVAARSGRPGEALSYLRRVLDLGYTYGGDPAGILTDPDLASLHGDPRFEELAVRIRGLATGM
jgi:serine/threonine protein kinase/Flp pilus assembly protein TadD